MDRVLAGCRPLRQQEPARFGRLRLLAGVAIEKRPRLVEQPFLRGVWALTRVGWLRRPEDWRPRGRGGKTGFQSLVEHLLVRFPVRSPLYRMLVSGESDPKTTDLLAVFLSRIAAGGSAYACVTGGLIPAPLTRRMCHHLIFVSTEETFVKAVRRAQVVGYGGDKKLSSAILESRLGREFTDGEVFWATVIHWFCRQTELDIEQVDPLIDYIAHRKEENADFAIGGRSVRALTRGMEEWHRELATMRKLHGVPFTPSGFGKGHWIERRKGRDGLLHEWSWTMTEILNSKELVNEGNNMRHCVAAYARHIEASHVSIWALRCGEERRLTVEVRNATRLVVQARGKLNRLPRAKEGQMLRRWATENGLQVGAAGMR